MPLRFRSVVPYTLPGVLVLIGSWWYISRKKEPIAGHESLENVPVSGDSLSPPTDGRNGFVEEGVVSPTTSKDGPLGVGNQKSQEGNAQILKPDDDDANQEQNAVAALFPGGVDVEPLLHSSNIESYDSHEPENCCEDTEKCPLSVLKLEPQEVIKPVPDVMEALEASVSPLQSVPLDHVEVAYATPVPLVNAKRPEPEGEVASVEVPVPCVAQPLKDCQNGNETEMAPEVLQNVTTLDVESKKMSTPLHAHQHLNSAPVCSAPPMYAHIEASAAPCHSEQAIELPGQQQQQQQLCSAANTEELELLAAGLIDDVISAATQEVFGVHSFQVSENGQPESSRVPSADVGPFTKEPITVHSPAPIECEFRNAAFKQEDKSGIINGFSATVVLEPSTLSEADVEKAWSGLRPTSAHFTPLPKPISEDAVDGVGATEGPAGCPEDEPSRDSLFSSPPCSKGDLFGDPDPSRRQTALPDQSAETSQEADVLDFTAGASLEELCEIKSLNGIGLRNGTNRTGETEADQSGGSDVNSMDSVDSGCTMGAMDSQSNTNNMGSNAEHIIWEIEVPKHLVGRLIGKQGRYVCFLKQNSAAKIYISTLPYTQEFQICHIEGTQQQVDKALSLIGKKFKDLDLANLYAPPPSPLGLPSLPMTSWLLLPSGVTVEVIVVNIVSAGHVFVQQHTHPTYHALRSLDQQMFLCYSQPGTPTLPSPAEVGVICAAPSVEGAWWRAQVITFYKETDEVEIRYVDYGGYDRVKIDTLRQIRSDFVTLPFQGAEVLLDNIAPQPGEDRFSTEANSTLEELTRGVALLAQVSNYDTNTGLPLIQLWNMVGDELVSINRTLAERGFSTWVDSF